MEELIFKRWQYFADGNYVTEKKTTAFNEKTSVVASLFMRPLLLQQNSSNCVMNCWPHTSYSPDLPPSNRSRIFESYFENVDSRSKY